MEPLSELYACTPVFDVRKDGSPPTCGDPFSYMMASPKEFLMELLYEYGDDQVVDWTFYNKEYSLEKLQKKKVQEILSSQELFRIAFYKAYSLLPKQDEYFQVKKQDQGLSVWGKKRSIPQIESFVECMRLFFKEGYLQGNYSIRTIFEDQQVNCYSIDQERRRLETSELLPSYFFQIIAPSMPSLCASLGATCTPTFGSTQVIFNNCWNTEEIAQNPLIAFDIKWPHMAPSTTPCAPCPGLTALWRIPSLCDCSITSKVVETDEEIKVPSSALALYGGEVFRMMLTYGMKEAQEKKLVLPYSIEAIQACMAFIHEGPTAITVGSLNGEERVSFLCELFKMGHAYQLPGLTAHCTKLLNEYASTKTLSDRENQIIKALEGLYEPILNYSSLEGVSNEQTHSLSGTKKLEEPFSRDRRKTTLSLETLHEAQQRRDTQEIIKNPKLFWAAFCKAYSHLPLEEQWEDFQVQKKDEKTLELSLTRGGPLESSIGTFVQRILPSFEEGYRQGSCSIRAARLISYEEKEFVYALLDQKGNILSEKAFLAVFAPTMTSLCASLGATCTPTVGSMQIVSTNVLGKECIEQKPIISFDIKWKHPAQTPLCIPSLPLPQGLMPPATLASLWKKPSLCDLSVKSTLNKGEISVPSLTLALYGGEFFHKMLTSGMKEAKEKSLSLSYPIKVIEALMTFIHEGPDGVTLASLNGEEKISSLFELFKMGHTYQVPALPEHCINLLIEYASTETLSEAEVHVIQELADLYEHPSLKQLHQHLSSQNPPHTPL